MSNKKDYVIIGNGTAGLSAAEEIRGKDEDANITIVTDENYLTYYRIKLSEAISKEFSDKQLFVRDENWYKEKNIKVVLNSKVCSIDIKNKLIETENDEKINYDKLLIATGSRSFIPPIKGSEKTGVMALRSLDDLKKIKEYFKDCKTVTVLGGGLLGLEAAWAIKQLDKEVNVVELSDQLLPRQLDEDTSAKFADILKEKGLNLFLGVSAQNILGENSVDGLKLSDGSKLETDAVLISAGVRPRLDLAADIDIECDRGIKVDKYMRTNIEDIYVAGDVAEVDGMVVGLWGISNDQGKTAGRNMAGDLEEYTLPELTTMLNIADCSIFSAGDIKNYDNIYEGNGDGDSTYKLCVKDGKITGGIIFNDIAKVAKVKKAIAEKRDIAAYIKDDISVGEIIENI